MKIQAEITPETKQHLAKGAQQLASLATGIVRAAEAILRGDRAALAEAIADDHVALDVFWLLIEEEAVAQGFTYMALGGVPPEDARQAVLDALMQSQADEALGDAFCTFREKLFRNG